MADLILKNGGFHKWPATIKTLRKCLAEEGVKASVPSNPVKPYSIGRFTILTPARSGKPDGDVIKEIAPVKVSGVWTQQWEARSYTGEEVAVQAQKLTDQYASYVQEHLDAQAKTRAYDGILSLCSYATSSSPVFGPEGLAGMECRDNSWAHTYQVLEDVMGGVRDTPTREELISELPVINWQE